MNMERPPREKPIIHEVHTDAPPPPRARNPENVIHLPPFENGAYKDLSRRVPPPPSDEPSGAQPPVENEALEKLERHVRSGGSKKASGRKLEHAPKKEEPSAEKALKEELADFARHFGGKERSPATRKEAVEKLQEIVRKFEKPNSDKSADLVSAAAGPKGEVNKAGKIENTKMPLAENMVATERSAMLEAEKAYLDEYKFLLSSDMNKGPLARTMDWVFQKKEKTSPELIRLKAEYHAKRIAYGQALTKSARARSFERPTHLSLKKRRERLQKAYPDFSGETIETMLQNNEDIVERYNRIVLFREIIAPTAEKKVRARAEVVDAQAFGALAKGLGWLIKGNAKLDERYGPYRARIIRAGAASLVFAGGGALIGTGATLLAIGGAGALAMVRAGTIGAAAAAAGTHVGTKWRNQTEKNVRHTLDTTDRTTSLTIDDLESVDEKRERLEGKIDERTLGRQTALRKAAVAASLGGIVTAASEILFSFLDVDAPSGAPKAGKAPDAAPGMPAAPAASVKIEMPGSEAAAEIEVTAKAGYGGIKLFDSLQDELRLKYPQGSDDPQIRHMLETSPEKLAEEYGFYKPGSEAESALVMKGSTLSFDEQGALAYREPGGEAVPLGRDYDFKTYQDTDAPSMGEPIAEPVSSPVESAPDTDAHTQTTRGSLENDASSIPDEKTASALFENKHHLAINPDETHIFKDEKGEFYAYGNDFAERFEQAQIYAKDHPGTPVHFEANIPVLHEGVLKKWVSTAVYTKEGGMRVFPEPQDVSYIRPVEPESFIRKET